MGKKNMKDGAGFKGFGGGKDGAGFGGFEGFGGTGGGAEFKGAAIWTENALWRVKNSVTGLEMTVNGEVAAGYVGKRAGLRALLEETADGRGNVTVKTAEALAADGRGDIAAGPGFSGDKQPEPGIEFASGALIIEFAGFNR